MKNYLYPIYKSKLKPWIKFWLYNKTIVKPVTGTYTLAEGQSPLTITDSLVANIKELKLYGATYQEQREGKNLFVGYDNMLVGFLPTTGSYPTTNPNFPNAKYFIIELSPGDSVTTSGITSNSNGRIRLINTLDQVVGTIDTGTYTLYSSTVSFGDGFKNGTITAIQNIKLGVMMTNNITTGLDNFQIEYGNTATSFEPYGYHPSPTNPSPIQIITGDTSFVISKDELTWRTVTLRLGSIEFCKIGTYEDEIYKDPTDNKWYLEKNIGKVVLNGSENWQTRSGATSYAYYISNVFNMNKAEGLSNYFIFYSGGSTSAQTRECIASANTTKDLALFTNNSNLDTVSNLKTWLSSNNVTVYYSLATPTTTEITDTNLLNDLELASNMSTYEGTNTISFSSLTPNISLEYLKKD